MVILTVEATNQLVNSEVLIAIIAAATAAAGWFGKSMVESRQASVEAKKFEAISDETLKKELIDDMTEELAGLRSYMKTQLESMGGEITHLKSELKAEKVYVDELREHIFLELPPPPPTRKG